MFQLNKQQTLHTNGKYEKSIYELQCMKDKGEKCYEIKVRKYDDDYANNLCKTWNLIKI